MTTLEDKLRTAALAFPGLTALLGGTDTNKFQWWDTQLTQNSPMPAVIALQIDGAPLYTTGGRNPLERIRVQFTIWGLKGQQARDVEQQVKEFLDGFNATGISSNQAGPNTIVNVRGGAYTQTSPIRYWRTMDAMIFNSDSN